MDSLTKHQIRPEHLNHHGTLYAGQITDWLTETAFICTAQFRGRTDHIVMAGADHIRLLRPMRPGEILDLAAEVIRLGTTSLLILVEGTELLTGSLCCRGEFVFVTVDDQGKKCPHGLAL